ncbi:unnamed protein product [Sphagnum balticum]
MIKRLIFLPQGQLSNNNKKILELSYRTLFALENQIHPSVEQCKKIDVVVHTCSNGASQQQLPQKAAKPGGVLGCSGKASEPASKRSGNVSSSDEAVGVWKNH